MALQPGSEYFDLSDYVGVLRRRWALIVAFTLIGLVLGGAYYYVTPRAYAATVLVQVNALPSNANQLWRPDRRSGEHGQRGSDRGLGHW